MLVVAVRALWRKGKTEMPTFRKHEHLRSPQEFQQVYDRRRSVSNEILILYAKENDLPYSRIGLSVSRKYGGAVERNRLRRLYREAYRLTKDELPKGLDLVLIPRSSEEPTLELLKSSLQKLVHQVAKRIAKDQPPSATPVNDADHGS